jgi:two-component system sensor histidine kinase QseC
MPSIRRRLTVRLLATVLVLFIASSLLLYTYVRARLTREYDATLAARARAVASLIQFDPKDGLEYGATDQDLAEYRPDENPIFFQVWRDDGTTIARSPSLENHAFTFTPVYYQTVQALTLPNGRSGRVLWLQTLPRVEEENRTAAAGKVPPITLAIAQEPRELNSTLQVLASALAIAALLLSAGAALVVTLTVRRSLAPLDRLARQADSIGPDSLDYQFPLSDLPAELRPIASRLNALLDRLREAFTRERRFTADVAHELRTPVAELRSLAEVALKWPDDADHLANYREILGTARQMEALITRLLSIARCDAGKQSIKRQTFDLCDIIRESWKSHEKIPLTLTHTIAWDIPSTAPIQSDRAMVLAMIDNLLSNAVTYTPPLGKIRVSISNKPTGVHLSITNSCHDISPHDLPHLLEPFWRKDPSRSSRDHCGLGLTLVAAYAKSLDLNFKIDLPEPHTFLASVQFPPTPIPAPTDTNAQNLPLPAC